MDTVKVPIWRKKSIDKNPEIVGTQKVIDLAASIVHVRVDFVRVIVIVEIALVSEE